MSNARLPRRSGFPSSSSIRRAGIRRNDPKAKVSSSTGESSSRASQLLQTAENLSARLKMTSSFTIGYRHPRERDAFAGMTTGSGNSLRTPDLLLVRIFATR